MGTFTFDEYVFGNSLDYEGDLIKWARENPQFHKGVHVALYTSGAKLIGYGKVTGMDWDPAFHEYLYDVEIYTGERFPKVSGQYLNRVIWPVKTANMFVVHKGGKL